MAGRRTTESAGAETLLVELLTEELPPKALREESEFFARELHSRLAKERFLPSVEAAPGADSNPTVYATPRRLAVRISNVQRHSPDLEREIQGPSVGSADQAIAGFAKKCGVAAGSLQKRLTPKGEVYVARLTTSGSALDSVLAGMVESTLKALPVPKIMRWGDGEVHFVRPVHGLVMLHGSRVVPGVVLGARSGNKTFGHRFLAGGAIVLRHADDYERALHDKGRVIVDYARRRADIAQQLERTAGGAQLVAGDDLLNEIAALVESPAVYAGEFSPDFLAVPEECLILSLQQHQKYVPLRDRRTGKLLPRFLFVSNLGARDPREIVRGNERVLRARLADARFFYDQDRKIRLEARVPRLATVVYHSRIGNQLERVERIQLLAGRIARAIGAGPLLAERAGWLSKADLLTEMVGEFPELQGTMGRYYAIHDGEPRAVADAIGDQYRTRLDDADPENLVSASLYLADRIEQLTGLFGIGERPTGEKDPYALRRAALGVISVFELLGAASRLTGRAGTDIKELLEYAAGLYPKGSLAPDTVAAVHAFVLDRYWNQLAAVFAKDVVEAVLSQQPPLMDVVPRVQAVAEFRRLPEADSLAAATKRARNILRREKFTGVRPANSELLVEEAERALAGAIVDIRGKVDAQFERRQFLDCLKTLAGVRSQVDTFFDKVLVNAADPKMRENRLALLSELDYLFNRVADISKLAA